MSLHHLINDLRRKSDQEPSSDDQVLACVIHQWVGTRRNGPTLTKRELEETVDELGVEFDHTVSCVLDNLVDHGFLDCFQNQDDPEWWVIRERDGEFTMGDDLAPAVHDELERAIQHVQLKDPPQNADPSAVADGGYVPVTSDGETLREHIAAEFGTPPSSLESHLRSGTVYERRDKLNTVVEAIEGSAAFSLPSSFDRIVVKHRANQYHLTKDVRREHGL